MPPPDVCIQGVSNIAGVITIITGEDEVCFGPLVFPVLVRSQCIPFGARIVTLITFKRLGHLGLQLLYWAFTSSLKLP